MILFFILPLISCTGNVNRLHRVTPNTYLSPEYEDESFRDVSMDICYYYTKYEYNAWRDSLTISMMLNFDETFRSYFADGIKMFSSFNEVGWVFYDYNKDVNYNFTDYKAKTKEGEDFVVHLTDSLTFFQEKSSSDFLFIVHAISVIQDGPTRTNKNQLDIKDYESRIYIEYSIWNNKNSDLVTKDNVTTSLKFKNLIGKWPFRGVVLKSAAEIFDKLPMFSN